jgi:hypothetical protein
VSPREINKRVAATDPSPLRILASARNAAATPQAARKSRLGTSGLRDCLQIQISRLGDAARVNLRSWPLQNVNNSGLLSPVGIELMALPGGAGETRTADSAVTPRIGYAERSKGARRRAVHSFAARFVRYGRGNRATMRASPRLHGRMGEGAVTGGRRREARGDERRKKSERAGLGEKCSAPVVSLSSL